MVKVIITYLLILSVNGLFAQEAEIKILPSKLAGNVYGPSYFRDYVVVCSDQKDRFLKTVMDQTNHRTTDLYMILDHTGNYKRFDESIRSDFNEGPATFDLNGSYMVLCQNLHTDATLKNAEVDKNPMALFESNFISSGWSTPKLLPFVDSAYQYFHPGLNEQGNKLVFSSNKPGGYGGFDIWISTNDGSGWTEPINAGGNVNTKENELFPSINERSIYFSSDRRGIGGLDIYSFDTLKSMSVLLDTPLNSIYDDFGFICRDNMSQGFFASNRDGLDNIWSFKLEHEDEIICDSIIPNNLCFSLTEEQASEIGEVEHLVYVWNINNEKIEGISIDYCFPEPGGYEITLDIIDTIVHQTFFNQSYYYLEINFAEQPYITSLDTVITGETFSLSAEESNLPDATILSYEWNLSDGTTRVNEKADHIFSTPGEYRVELIVEVNQWDSVFFDCVYKTIQCYDKNDRPLPHDLGNILDDTSKIINETQFFAENTDTSSVVYSIEVIKTKEKLSNDNFLFTLMETYGEVKIHYNEEKDEYSYLVGEWDNIEEAHPAWQQLMADGYEQAIVRSLDLDLVSRFSLDNSFELDNVRFDEGRWDIRPDAIQDLDNIIEIMLVFPDINLNIEAHTNSRGEENSNLELSIKRAESVKGYIVTQGVDPTRISAEGKGESKPKMSNETPEGLEANRRVEFTFLK
jgi:outer membrane protein OmpA-like peptidoglycan-associated protein